jgi:hypothetical protein
VQAVNIAFGATIVDRSGDFNADFASERAFDGAVRDVHSAQGPAAYWLSPNGGGSGGYFVADLGSSQQIAEISLRPTSNSQFDDRGTLDFQIRGSNSLGDITGPTPTAAVILASTLTNVTGGAMPLLVHDLLNFSAADGLSVGSYQYLRFESLSANIDGLGSSNAGLGELMARSDLSNIAYGAPIVDGSGAWSGGTPGVGETFNGGGFPAAHVTDGVAIESETLVGGGEGDWWLGREQTLNEFFTLDLGTAQDIGRIDLLNTHNRQFNDRGTADFNIQGSLDGTNFFPIVDGTLANAAGSGSNIPVESFDVDSNARYLRFEAESYYGSSSGLNEIRVFIPEPATGALFGLGGLLFALRRRRR